MLHSEKCLQHLVVIWAAAVFHMNCMSLTILRKDGSQPLKKGNRYLLSFAPRMMTKNASFYSTNIRNNYHFVLTKHNADKLWVKDSRLVLMYQARRVLHGQLSNEYFDVSKIHTLHCPPPLTLCIWEFSCILEHALLCIKCSSIINAVKLAESILLLFQFDIEKSFL